MASRAPLPGSSLSGSTLVATVNARLATLFDASVLPLTSVGGTADVVTATCDPALTAGLVAGMKFSITWGAENTGSVTLNINGGGAVAVLKATGGALNAGDLASGLRSLVEYHGGSFYLQSPTAGQAAEAGRLVTLTSSTSWTVPVDLPEDTLILVQAWAGGGGGHSTGGGGGGGGYAETWLQLADLGSSVTVTIGAGGTGGASSTSGGNTTFGAFLTAYRGIRGATNKGGGGGGTNEAGAAEVGGYWGGGNGASVTAPDPEVPGSGGALWGGGGGGLSNAGYGGVFGGGGGAGAAGSGGTSKFGGNGGANGVAGTAPAGGGGRNAPGARGEIRILIPR